jgi:putative transposon-encoded protein
MSKPVILIRVERKDFFSTQKLDEISILMKQLVKNIGNDYHVVAIPKETDISVLNGLSFEIDEKDLEKIKIKLLGE